MAPDSGKRPQVQKPRYPRPPQVIDEQNVNSEGRNEIVSKPRLSRSAQVTAKKGVSQPGTSRRTTSGPQGHVTSNQLHPQNMTSSAVDIARALPPDSSPTKAKNIHPSPSQPLTTAENVGQLNIYGGWFLNSPQAVVQVHGEDPSKCGLVDPEEKARGHDSSLAVPDLEDIENGDAGTQSARQSTQSKCKAKADSQCTQMEDYDVYYRQLLLAGRGSPMWIPGPNMNLPIEYRRNGIRIGDVGIVYRSQGFTFLFNIFLAADHPVNKRRVPDDFEPFDFGQVEMDLEKTIVYGRGHHLASSSLRNIGGVDLSGHRGLVFETVASEGAILVMPDGATTEDLYNHKLVKKYIAKNAQSWYTYIREKRGREVDNGDIRLVIGSDKVASWGIATFSGSVEQRVRFEFKTNDSDQLDASRTYTWNCVGGGCGRVGPHEKEMKGLREPNDASAAESVLENQTVFVRTLNFNLKGEAWDGLTIHEIRSSDHSSNNSGPPSNQQPPSSSSGGQSSTGSESHSGQGNVNFQAAQFGSSVIQHPSNQLNDLLLKKFPNAQIIVASDADWMSVLTKEDIIFPSPEVLCARLLSSRKLREEDGVVTFDDDHANSDGEVAVTRKRNLNALRYNAVAPATHSRKDLAPYMLQDNHMVLEQKDSTTSEESQVGCKPSTRDQVPPNYSTTSKESRVEFEQSARFPVSLEHQGRHSTHSDVNEQTHPVPVKGTLPSGHKTLEEPFLGRRSHLGNGTTSMTGGANAAEDSDSHSEIERARITLLTAHKKRAARKIKARTTDDHLREFIIDSPSTMSPPASEWGSTNSGNSVTTNSYNDYFTKRGRRKTKDTMSPTGSEDKTLDEPSLDGRSHPRKGTSSMTRDTKATEDSNSDLEVENARIALLKALITCNDNKARAMDDTPPNKPQESEHPPHSAIPYPHIPTPAYQYPVSPFATPSTIGSKSTLPASERGSTNSGNVTHSVPVNIVCSSSVSSHLFCRTSFSDIYYDQHLQSLPQVLREGAVEFDKLKAIIQGIVDELMETGLSPQLLRGAMSDRQETGIDGNHTPETAHNPVPEITQQCSVLRRPKVVYELKSELGQLVSQLRVWISPSPEETKESKAGCMVVSPSVLRAATKGISFPLGTEKIGNTDNFGWHEQFGTLKSTLDPTLSEHLIAITDKTNEVEFVVPLVRDAEFFTTLAHNLDDVSSKMKQLYSVFSETIADLAKTIEDTCQPASVAANFHPYSSVTTHAGTVEVKANHMKSDLYAWRDIFRLYVEAEVFEYSIGGVKGEWSLDESEKRLKSFVNQVAQGRLPVSRNVKQRRLLKKGLGGSKKFKYKQSVGALEAFIKLNLLVLDIKKFSYVTAEAITDLLRTRTERSALPTPFSLKDGRAIPSSPIPLHPPLQLPSFLTVESLAPTLFKPFLHSIETTLIPNVPSLDDYSCVICMNIAFKPVRLSCTHLFCVRCLVKMQKRGEGNCPSCRARSVLCANSTNVDWALLNFMEDWFPREAREKLKANEKEITAELLSEYHQDLPAGCCVT